LIICGQSHAVFELVVEVYRVFECKPECKKYGCYESVIEEDHTEMDLAHFASYNDNKREHDCVTECAAYSNEVLHI